MGRRAFLLEIPQAVQDQNLTGADLTAGRTATGEAYAVEKSAAASTAHTILTDDAGGLTANAGIDLVDNTITFTNGSTSIPGGDWTLINRNIVIGTAATAGNLNIPATTPLTKLRLVNCNITCVNVHQFADFIFSVGVGDGGADQTRANDSFEATSNSLDVWGCNFAFSDAGRVVRFSDFIQSEFFFGQNGPQFFSGSGGGRWINSTISSLHNQININSNGLNIYENAIINNLVFRHGNTGPNQIQQFVIDRPTFNFPTQASYYDFNTTSSTAQSIFGGTGTILQRQRMPFHIIGGPSWGDTAIGSGDTAWGNLNAAADEVTGGVFQALDTESTPAGAWHYYGFGNRYFSTAVQAEGDAVAGVRARLTSNIAGGTLTQGVGDIGTRSNPSPAANIMNATGVSITGVTGTDGRFEPETYNTDGTTEVAGLLNFWDWNARPAGDDIIEGAPAITVDDNVWNATLERVTSPAGMMLIPIARVANPQASSVAGDFLLFNFDVTEEVRSFRWDVDEQERAIAYPDIRENLIIPQQGITVSDLSVGVIKTQNLNTTTNLPDISFPTNAAVSINDIRDAHRAAWSDYAFDLAVPTTFTNTLTLDITVDNAAATDYTATSATEITVRGNGIAADGTNDHYLADANIGELVMGNGTNNNSIEGHTLTVATNVVEASNITNSTITTGMSLQARGTIENSTLNVGTTLEMVNATNSTLDVTGSITIDDGAVLDRVSLLNSPTINLSANANIVPLNRDTMTGVLGSGWDLIVPEGFTASATPPISRLFTPQGVGGTYEITLTPDQAMSYFGIRMTDDDTDDSLETSNNITFRTPPLDESFVTFDVPASFDGRVAIAWRDQGLTGSDAWTLVGSVYDFTGAHPTIATLGNANSDYGRGATGVPYVVTAGRGYRMRFQEINFPTTPGESAVFSVFPDTDTNYTTAISGINTGAVITDDTLVEDAGTGHIEINITHADRSTTDTTWNSAFTARVFAECRNDVDYISEVLENGAVEDFIQLTGSGTILLGGVVTFTRGAGETSQQFIQGVDFMPGASITFSQTVTGCNDVVIFPASDVITGQQIRDALAEDFAAQTTNVNENLQQLNDNVRIASVKPEAVQNAQLSTPDLPNN